MLVRTVLLALLLMPFTAHAAFISVAAGVVEIAADGQCSLREAIENAETDSVMHGDCFGGSGADTISLGVGTYTLAQAATGTSGDAGLPFITTDITIRGRNAIIERDGALSCTLDRSQTVEEFRIFDVVSNTPDPSLTLQDLTLRNGCADGTGRENDGGAIRAESGATLVVERVTFENNSAWDKSGAIDGADLTLTVRDSHFVGNRGDGGAGAIGLNSNTSIVIEGSTFQGNMSGGDGGGAFGGGGLDVMTGPYVIRNSTFSGNSTTGAGGGAIGVPGGVLTIENTTITANMASAGAGGGVGVGRAGILTIRNSLVVGNSAALNGDCFADPDTGGGGALPGTIAGTGDNLDSDGTCVTAAGSGFTQVMTSAVALGPLQDNGGLTPTHALGASSVAIDAVMDCTQSDMATAISVDQRGAPRPLDGDGSAPPLCDIGAYEFGDIDADGVADGIDNCPMDANGDQLDVDMDGTGDACDANICTMRATCTHTTGIQCDPINVTQTGGGDGDFYVVDDLAISATDATCSASSYGMNVPPGSNLSLDNLSIVAETLPGQGTTSSSCTFTITGALPGGGSGTRICTIDAASDGLPVTLQSFAID